MSAKRFLLMSGAVVVASTAAPLSAQTIVTDRPDFTESTATVPDGRFQIEAGYTYSTVGDWTNHEIGEGLIRYGVIPGLELRLDVPTYVSQSLDDAEESGFTNVGAGIKLGLYDSGLAEGLPSVALLLGTGIPTGSEDIGQGEGWEPEAILALGWQFTESLSLGANVGYAQRTFPGFPDRWDEFSASIAAGFPLFGGLNGFAEYFAIRPELDDIDEDYIDGGVTYLLSPTFQLDARVGLGVGDTEDAMFFGVGLAKLF